MQWEYLGVQALALPVDAKLRFSVWTVGGHLWDYEAEPIGPFQMLNLLGAEGWELVSETALVDPRDPDSVVFDWILKRPRA